MQKLEQIVLVAVVEGWKCQVWPSKTKLFRCAEAIDVLPCEAEKLYCEEIDLGEEKPRQVRDRVDRVYIECLWCAHFVLEALQFRQFPMRSLWNCNDLRSSGRLLENCLRRSVGRCWLQKLPNKIVKDGRNSHTFVLCADCIWAPCASKAGGLEWIAGFWRLGKTRWWRSCWKETPLYNSMLFHYVSTPELQVLSNKEIKQISGSKSNLSCFSSAFPLGRLQVKRPWHWLAWDSQARVVAT